MYCSNTYLKIYIFLLYYIFITVLYIILYII